MRSQSGRSRTDRRRQTEGIGMSVYSQRGHDAAPAVPDGGPKQASRTLANGTSYQVHVDTLTTDEWDRLATEFDDLTYDQIARFANGQWGANRMSNLVLRRDGIAVAGIQLPILMIPGVSRGLAYGRFGPIWRRRDSKKNLDIYRAVVGAVVDEYCHRRGHYLTLVPRPNPENYCDECSVLREFGFRVLRPFDDRNRYLIDSSL